jgi:hypothetical protein
MVYVVQSYWAGFGLYPSSCKWKTKDHNVSVTGSVSVLRWMGQDKPIQLGPLEKASLNQSIYFSTCTPPTLIHFSHHFTNASKPAA